MGEIFMEEVRVQVSFEKTSIVGIQRRNAVALLAGLILIPRSPPVGGALCEVQNKDM
jgi:hypothetical protein